MQKLISGIIFSKLVFDRTLITILLNLVANKLKMNKRKSSSTFYSLISS